MKTAKANRIASEGRAIRLLAAGVALVLCGVAISVPARADSALAKTTPITDRSSYNLTDAEWDVLGQLQDQCYEVACGNTTSVTFEFDSTRLLGQSEWTADDYGIEPVSVYKQGPSEEISVNPEIRNVVEGKISDSLTRALTVLRYEKPAITEWLRDDGASRVNLKWSVNKVGGEWHVSIMSATCTCAVVPYFAGEELGTVDPYAIQEVQDCLAVAQEIAERHAGEPAHERLVSYHRELHDLSAYDESATATGSYLADTRPWTIISVFDGKTSTRSVCVGYCRAMKLLVELSGRDDVQCHIATGYATSPLANGLHMWCVNRMPDGRNYLNDVTNSGAYESEGWPFYGCATGTPDGTYTAGPRSDRVTFTNDDKMLDVYSWDALVISDAPYVVPAPPQEEVTHEQEAPAPEQEAPTAEEDEAIVLSVEPEAGQEEEHDWSIPVVDNTYSIAPDIEDEATGRTKRTWVTPAIAIALLVSLALVITVPFVLASKVPAMRNRKVFFVLIVLVNLIMLAVCAVAMPSTADASPVLTPVEDRGSYTLDEGEWNALWQIQQQCYDLTCGARTSTVFDLDVAGLLGTNEWEIVGTNDVRWEEGEIVNYSLFASRVNGRVQYSMDRVLAVLSYEKPSLTEWMSMPGAFRVDFESSIRDYGGQRYACVISARVSCIVRPEFANGSDYEVRPDSTQQIQASIDRAWGVVNRHAGEAPLTRLRSYADEIYGLTTYAYGAAYNDYEPRGFVSVFDGNPSTRTVCAGYSKAFKLLVELSGETDIQCHMTDGMLESGNGQVAHAWNIVRMPDGRNYMADITNNNPSADGAGMVLVCPAYADGDWYSVPLRGQTVHYLFSDLNRETYQPEALVLSDTPYAQAQQSYAPSTHAVEEDATPVAKPSKKAEPVIVEDEKADEEPQQVEVQQEEPKREWDIPLVDHKEKITLTEEDMGEYPTVENPDWLEGAAGGVIVVALLGVALIVLL